MEKGDKVISKVDGHIGTIAYEVDSTKAMERRWCVHFPDSENMHTLGDFDESELALYTNVLEGANVGDKFVTGDGRIATVWKIRDTGLDLRTENSIILIYDGEPLSRKYEDAIISKYKKNKGGIRYDKRKC